MPNTYGGAILEGLRSGTQDATQSFSAIYGLKSQMQKAKQEQDLYDIQMKEYQRGQEPADWGKVGDFLDAGEEGLNYAKGYAGSLGMDPDKMTRRDMKEFGQIFGKDQVAAHHILRTKIRHYGKKIKEYSSDPDEYKDLLKLYEGKLAETTQMDKDYVAYLERQKIQTAMGKIAQMTDKQLEDAGYVPAIRTIAQSGDVETFGEIMKEVVKAQVKPPTAQMKVVPDSASATGYSYKDVSGGGVPAPAPAGKAEKSATEWNLLERAQRGDKEAIAILDSKEKRDLRIKEKEKEIGGLPNIGSIPTTPPGVKNPAALEGLSPGEAAVVKQLADYKVQLPSGMALRTPYWQGILERASLYDSSFDATQYNVRLGVRKDFTSGKAALNIRSLNTAVHHLNTLVDSAKKLENSPVQLWNAISNKGLTAVGDPRVTNFLNAATAIEGELANVFKNTGATDQEIKSWRENLNTSFSPAQLRGAMNTVIKLLSGRLAALRNQYEVGMGRPKDFRILSGDSLKIIQGLGIDPNTVDPVGAQSGMEGLNVDRNAIDAELRRRGL